MVNIQTFNSLLKLEARKTLSYYNKKGNQFETGDFCRKICGARLAVTEERKSRVP